MNQPLIFQGVADLTAPKNGWRLNQVRNGTSGKFLKGCMNEKVPCCCYFQGGYLSDGFLSWWIDFCFTPFLKGNYWFQINMAMEHPTIFLQTVFSQGRMGISIATVDGQNIQTLRRRITCHPAPQISMFKQAHMTIDAGGFHLFCPPIPTLGRSSKL